jgi:hypothetical protein
LAKLRTADGLGFSVGEAATDGSTEAPPVLALGAVEAAALALAPVPFVPQATRNALNPTRALP